MAAYDNTIIDNSACPNRGMSANMTHSVDNGAGIYIHKITNSSVVANNRSSVDQGCFPNGYIGAMVTLGSILTPSSIVM